jgi:type II secretory pathway component GspD/PulD (secretin)
MLGGLMLALALFAPRAGAQTQPAVSKAAETKPCTEAKISGETKSAPESYQIFYLANVTQQNDLTDISTALRNMLPQARLYAMPTQNAITMHGTAEDIQLAKKMIAELDLPKKIYRLTYTITETDGGKRTGTQNFALIAVTDQMVLLKQGSRVPVFVGTNDAKSSKQVAEPAGAQMQYQDVRLTITATAEGSPEGLRLRSKIEQSSLAEEKSGVGAQDPEIRQTVLEGFSTLALGKPLVLGSLDLPGGTRKREIEVVAELVK